MAQAYTRLIELKVKDTDLGRALDKLNRSLQRIEDKLETIGGKGGKGFTQVAKGAEKAATSIQRLGKQTSFLSSASKRARLDLVTTTAGVWLANKAVTALDSSMRGVTVAGLKPFAAAANLTTGKVLALKASVLGLAAAHPLLTTAALTGAAAYTLFGSNVGNVAKKLVGLTKTAYVAGRAVRRAVSGGGSTDAPRPTGPSSPIGIGSARGLEVVRPKLIKSQVGGLTKINKELNRARAIQENINAFATGHARAIRDVAETQVKYNVELLKTKAVQAVVTADIWAGQKALQGMAATARGVTGFLGGLFGGKFGGTGQAAGIIGLSRTVEALTGKLGFLNKAWIKNVNSVALFSARASEAITGISLAYKGLSGILGAADWTIGAVKGFMQFEKAAAQSIWRVQHQWQKFSGIMGAALMFGFNPFGKGSAYDIHEMAMGGRVREEEKRYTHQGLTDEQYLKEELRWQKQLLENRNVEAEDFTRIQAKILEYERKISEEQRRRSSIGYGKLEASGLTTNRYGKGLSTVQQARLLRKKEAAAERFALNRSGASVGGGFLAFDQIAKKIQADTKKIKDVSVKSLNLETKRTSSEAYLPGTAGPARPPGAWQNMFSMGRGGGRKGIFGMSRAQRISSMASSGMIGGGFPLLFGQGGMSAVGGGIGGVAGGALGGGFGFAGSIVGTALASAVQDAINFQKEIDKVNNAIRSTGSESLISAGSIRKLASDLDITKEEALEATKAFAQFGGKERTALTRKYGKDPSAFYGLVGATDSLKVLEQINTLRGKDNKINDERAKTLIGILNTEGLISAQIALRTDTEDRASQIEEARKVTLKDRMQQIAAASSYQENMHTALGEELLKLMDINYYGEERVKALEKQWALQDQIFEKEKEWVTLMENAAKYAQVKQDLEQLLDPMNQLVTLATEFSDAFSSSFKGIVTGSMSAQKALETLFRRTADAFLDMAAQILAAQIRAKIVGMFAGIFKINLGSTTTNTSMVSGVSDADLNKYSGRAAGGPVTGGSPYIVGEKGPELFVPNSSGNVVPSHAMGGSMVVNVDASGSSAEGDSDRSRQLGELIGAAVQSEIIRQQRPGGTLF